MKFRLLFLFFLSGTYLHVMGQHDPCVLIKKTDDLFKKQHIEPLQYSPVVYHQLLDLYMNTLDAEGLVFSRTDSNALHQKIEKATSLCEVFTFTQTYIVKKLKVQDSLVHSLDLTYLTNNSLNEQFVLPCSYGRPRQPDEKALLVYDRKYFKYIFLLKNHLLKEANLTLDPQKVLNAIVQKRTVYLKKLMNSEKGLVEVYLKALSLRHDPHSVFLNASEKQEWLVHLSKEEYSFGFELEKTENEMYKIAEMLPGGAAWNSKQLEVGDFIDQIELANGKKYLAGIDTDEDFYNAFLAKENHTLTFYLTKVDGTKAKAKLTKAKTEVFDNVINAYIFYKDKQRLGYVDLPSFYSAENPYGGNGCASDLAREILQLKKDSIDGLIIDLRGNGGGYMHEALAIAGLFIDEGVLALKQERGDKPRYLKDPNRGTLYDGKLIVLVNNYSASASELLAGILQQYNRALIVGNSTYGKATMQVFLPIDSIAETKNVNDYYANVTIGKFYMINKKTHQSVGIQPDIHLPSLYDYMDSESEATSLYFLKPDSVNKNLEVHIYSKREFNGIKENSALRVTAAKWEGKFKAIADSVNFYLCGKQSIALNQKTVFAWEESKNKFFKNMEQASYVDFKPYAIRNTSMYNNLLKEHEIYTKPNQFKIEKLQRDVRLFETLTILSDYILQP